MTLHMHADFNYIYKDGRQFFPLIQEGASGSIEHNANSAIVIELQAHPDDDLLWINANEQALEAIRNHKLILWDLDLGLHSQVLETESSMQFFNFGIAIQEFVEKVWNNFKEHTLGVILYRGNADFTQRFAFTEDMLAHFLETIHDDATLSRIQKIIDTSHHEWVRSLDSEPLFHFYVAGMFAQYMQRLSSYLPEELLVFALIDLTEIQSTCFAAYLLSKERFGHILLGLKHARAAMGHLNWQEGACLGGWIGRGSAYFSTISEVKIAICLSDDVHFSIQLESAMNFLFDELAISHIPCRTIPESQLTEAWDGIDYIVVPPFPVSYQLKRRLQGFCAAGGTVVFMGESIGLASEIAFSEFRQRLSSQEALI